MSKLLDGLFSEWAKEYGDIYSLKIGPDNAIVVSSMKAVKELMDQQSNITCDRPKSYMADVMYQESHAGVVRYNDTWRRLRKTMHAILTPAGTMEHLPIQLINLYRREAEATQLIYDILHSSGNDLCTHLRRYSTSVISSVVFGKRFPRRDCPEMDAIFKSVEVSEAVFEIRAHPPVDQLPFLNYIPDRWARWKRLAKLGHQVAGRIYFHLLGLVEERIRSGGENGCYIETVIKNQEEYGLSRKLVGYLGGALLDGGAHTTSAFLLSMVLCLIAFPEVQKKAHEEIDRVIGQDRAPRLEDFASLPYCQALLNETHRFRPVAPLGIPHAMLTDGLYRGYVLPKGSIVFINAWGIYHDPDVYEDPETFNPDRYLQNEFGAKPGVDTSHFRNNIVFGSGRRICPGQHLANTSLALNVMNLLWAFEFSPDEMIQKKGTKFDIWNYRKGSFYEPAPFPCSIKSRSAAKVSMIEEQFSSASSLFENFESGDSEIKDLDDHERMRM
ncbi:hypothetical protein D9758_008521 [Tetrapyrgos nigripes]|uniref:Cytochrome P450 n=1 Tax=Tetrapyrgos nigripes TaxID=182062 RepID=A0A8H5G5N0_9AGAR|nr:hypothetical protein D9758_008521 [Tetrapyrgos nigripes]